MREQQPVECPDSDLLTARLSGSGGRRQRTPPPRLEPPDGVVKRVQIPTRGPRHCTQRRGGIDRTDLADDIACHSGVHLHLWILSQEHQIRPGEAGLLPGHRTPCRSRLPAALRVLSGRPQVRGRLDSQLDERLGDAHQRHRTQRRVPGRRRRTTITDLRCPWLRAAELVHARQEFGGTVGVGVTSLTCPVGAVALDHSLHRQVTRSRDIDRINDAQRQGIRISRRLRPAGRISQVTYADGAQLFDVGIHDGAFPFSETYWSVAGEANDGPRQDRGEISRKSGVIHRHRWVRRSPRMGTRGVLSRGLAGSLRRGPGNAVRRLATGGRNPKCA